MFLKWTSAGPLAGESEAQEHAVKVSTTVSYRTLVACNRRTVSGLVLILGANLDKKKKSLAQRRKAAKETM